MKKLFILILTGLFLLSSCSHINNSNEINELNSESIKIINSNDTLNEIYDISGDSATIMYSNEFPDAKVISETNEKELNEYQTAEKNTDVIFETEGKIHSAILINNGIIYFGNENCEFYAVDIKTGTQLWVYKTDFAVETLPVFAEGKIIFNAADSFYILDAENGNEISKLTYESNNSSRLSIDAYAFNDTQAAVFEGTAYYSALNGDIVAVDINNGNLLWSVKTKTQKAADSGINYFNGNLFWSDSSGVLNCFDINKKELKYQTELSENIYAPMLIDNGKIYIAGRNCMMYCINTDDGNVIWRSYSKDKTTWFSGGSVIIGDALYTCTSDERTLVSYDKTNGDFKRIYPIGANGYTMPVLNGNNIIVAATDVYSKNKSYIMEFDTVNHTMLWQAVLDDCVLSSPAVYENAVYFGSDSGKIYKISI